MLSMISLASGLIVYSFLMTLEKSSWAVSVLIPVKKRMTIVAEYFSIAFMGLVIGDWSLLLFVVIHCYYSHDDY